MIFLIVIFICYIVVELIKQTSIHNEWLPLISGGLGVLLTVISFFALPTLVPVTDLGEAIGYGFFSGLAATGGNQVFKQTVKYIKNKYGIDINIGTGE